MGHAKLGKKITPSILARLSTEPGPIGRKPSRPRFRMRTCYLPLKFARTAPVIIGVQEGKILPLARLIPKLRETALPEIMMPQTLQ